MSFITIIYNMTTLVTLNIADMIAQQEAKIENPKFEVGDYYDGNGVTAKNTIVIKRITKCFIVYDYIINMGEKGHFMPTLFTNIKVKVMNKDNDEYVTLKRLGKKIYARELIKV